MVMCGFAPPSTCHQACHGRSHRSAAEASRAVHQGSATVADRPIVCTPGCRRRRRASPERQEMPAFRRYQRMQLIKDDIAQVLEETARHPWPQISRASCSGVVSNISGGASFCRWRLWAGVSPVRVSSLMPRPISSIGFGKIALNIDGQRLERRNIERVNAAARCIAFAAAGLDRPARGESQPASCPRRLGQSAGSTALPAPPASSSS